MGKFIEVPDNVKKEFERVLTSGGLFKIVSQHPNYSGGTHYQILSTKAYEKNDFNKIVDKMTDMIDKFDNKYDCSITWNFGYQDDKYISAGIDMRKMWVEDSCKDEIHPNGGHIKIYEVDGKKYKVYADFSKRAVIAENVETGEKHNLSSSGYISNEKTIKERIKMYFKDSDEELFEDAGDYIYLFPLEDMTSQDIQKAKSYGLQILGKNYFQGEKNLVVKGTLSNLKRYCKDYLDYDMHPSYLYKEDEFAGDITDSCKDAKIFTVFPDDGSAPQDFNSLKEAINYGNKYHKQGFIIESPNDMDLYLHYVNGNKVEDSVKDSQVKDSIDKNKIKNLVNNGKYPNTYYDMKKNDIQSSSAREIADIARKLGVEDKYSYEWDGYHLDLNWLKDKITYKDSINPKHQSLIQVINKLNKYKDSKVKDYDERILNALKQVAAKGDKIKSEYEKFLKIYNQYNDYYSWQELKKKDPQKAKLLENNNKIWKKRVNELANEWDKYIDILNRGKEFGNFSKLSSDMGNSFLPTSDEYNRVMRRINNLNNSYGESPTELY